MAIIYVDRLEATLQEAIDEAANTLTLTAGAGIAIARAAGWAAEVDDVRRSFCGERLVRIPLYISNGVAVERVFGTCALDTGVVTVMRGASPIAWSAGATVRSAPPADFIAAGFETRAEVEAAQARVIPGETVIWKPTATTIKAGLPMDNMGLTHAGEDWPAQLVIGNGGVERTLEWWDIEVVFPRYVAVGGAGVVNAITLPDTCLVARIEVRKVPTGLLFGSPFQYMARVELY